MAAVLFFWHNETVERGARAVAGIMLFLLVMLAVKALVNWFERVGEAVADAEKQILEAEVERRKVK